MDELGERERIQAEQYRFPYHFIPSANGGAWSAATGLFWSYEYLAVLETVLALVLRQKPARVLDFGCGEGRLTRDLLAAGVGEVIGVETNERARYLARGMVDPALTVFGNLEEAAGQFFDVVVAMEVLEHIPPKAIGEVMSRLHDVLSANGHFVVSVPTTNVPVGTKHYRHFTKALLEEVSHPWFRVDEFRFVHKVGILNKILIRAVVNRFLMATWPPWLALITRLYRTRGMPADESTGTHLVAVLTRV